jgi:SHS2 domain-containing protein
VRGRPDYRVLDHPSDLLIEVRAMTPEDLFADAAVALCREIAGRVPPPGTQDRVLDASGFDAGNLMVRWLAALIPLVYDDGLLVTGFSAIEVRPDRARGMARVLPWRDAGLPPRLEVKAVTYHALTVRLTPGDSLCRVLLDL